MSWTSKSTKKQNGTIENSVFEWSELENSQEKGWLRHGVPVRETEWRNTNKSLGNSCVHMYVCVCVKMKVQMWVRRMESKKIK